MSAEKVGSKMEVKFLSDNLKTRVSSDAQITSFLQCITELVFNSLDSKATAIAVRINTLSFQLQVIDNGEGITRANMELIGHRYMTSKCSSLSDLRSKRCKYYGYKGESLASVRELSRTLSVTSRPAAGQGETFYKTFSGMENPVRVRKVEQRSSKGTTVNIEGFLFNHPVRQERINPEIELGEIKKFLQGVGIIHPDVSLTLRNELTGCVILTHPKSKTVSNAIINLCCDDLLLDRDYLHEVKVKKHNVSVSGLIYTEPHANDKLQFIYVNKRLTELKSLSQLINRTVEVKLFKDTGGGGQKLHPVYVLNIACPRFDFDCSQFKNWDVLVKCVEKLIGQVAGGSPAEERRKSLSETDFKSCSASKHMGGRSKKVRSDSTLEVKTKSSKPMQFGSGVIKKPDQTDVKCVVKENKSEDFFEEQSNESRDVDFLYFRNCNLVGGKSKKPRQTQFGTNKSSRMESEIKKKGNEHAKEKVLIVESNVENENEKSNRSCKFENEKRHKREGLNVKQAALDDILQDQKQKSNSSRSQDVIIAKKRLLSNLEDNQTERHFHADQNQGKEFIMDRFMESLSKKSETSESEYNILQDISFVNEKGTKRLEKLNRQANLIITNRLGNSAALLEPPQKQLIVESDSKFIFPDNQNYNSVLCKKDDEEEAHGIPNEKELTYKSHYNNIFLPCNEKDSEPPDDVKERFYQTIIETCKGAAKLDDPSRFFACTSTSDYVFSEEEYEIFKKDLDSYMLRETPRALLNRTSFSTFVFRNNGRTGKSGDRSSFRLNINFTGVYQNERLFEASKVSLFYTTRRRTSDVASVNRETQNWKPFGDGNEKNLGVDNERNRGGSAVVNQSQEDEGVVTQNHSSLFPVNTNNLNKENLKLNLQESVELMDSSVLNCAMLNSSPQLVEECIKQNHSDAILRGEGKGQRANLNLDPEEKIENCETDSRSQLVEEWIKQEDTDTKTYYLNTRTGMSSSLNCPRSPSKFTLKKRPQFIPKGLSPIVKHVKEVDTSLQPSEKGRLQNAIIEVYDNDLEIIKNSSTRVEDLQDFLDQYYEENHKKFGSVALNAYNKHVSHELYAFTRNLFDELQIIGQFDFKFIVSQCKSSGVIFLFDQHAVGERIQLEKLLKEYTTASSSTKYKSTRCKEFTVKFPPEDVFVINNYRQMFEHLGLSFQALENCLQIKKVPLCFYNKSVRTVGNSDATLSCLVQSLIEEEQILLRSTRGKFSKIPNCIRDVINSEACRGAVKFGDELSPSDCHKYIRELSKCQLPFHCAHGRPTVIPLVKLGDAKENVLSRLAAPNLKNLLVNKCSSVVDSIKKIH